MNPYIAKMREIAAHIGHKLVESKEVQAPYNTIFHTVHKHYEKDVYWFRFEDKRLKISTSYNEFYKECRALNISTSSYGAPECMSIGVSASKSAAQIAEDIARRLADNHFAVMEWHQKNAEKLVRAYHEKESSFEFAYDILGRAKHWKDEERPSLRRPEYGDTVASDDYKVRLKPSYNGLFDFTLDGLTREQVTALYQFVCEQDFFAPQKKQGQ